MMGGGGEVTVVRSKILLAACLKRTENPGGRKTFELFQGLKDEKYI
jgi:hypothetical protein